MRQRDLIDRVVKESRAGLIEIGYHDDLVKRNYRYTDVFSPQNEVLTIQLAAFAQDPPSYENAGLGIAVSERDDIEAVSSYKALGAPQVLVLNPHNSTLRRWQIRGHSTPKFIEDINASHLPAVIRQHRNEWSPSQVLRAKEIGYNTDAAQLDFYDSGVIPAIEEVLYPKLDSLLRKVIAQSRLLYVEKHASDPDYQDLFRLIFRLVAAKLLIDRQHTGTSMWDASNAQSVIGQVERFYFHKQSSTILTDEDVQDYAWRTIRDGFNFPNLSLKALASIYESTLVSSETRKTQDTHATPPQLAEYIVQHLPFQHLDQDKRHVFEPFCGHAPFLIAAMSRLRNLLPPDMSAPLRHEYFRSMLRGMENDSFAREVALCSMMLADYPNANGWDISLEDVFSSPNFDSKLRESEIVLCNPPYGTFSREQRNDPVYSLCFSYQNKAVEALHLVLKSR